MGKLDGVRWKQVGVGSAIVTVCFAGVERGYRTIETVHAVDYLTHLNESPLLKSLQHLIGTPAGIGVLFVTALLLGGVSVRLWLERNSLRVRISEHDGSLEKYEPREQIPTPSSDSAILSEVRHVVPEVRHVVPEVADMRQKHRVRTVFAEYEETHHITVAFRVKEEVKEL